MTADKATIPGQQIDLGAVVEAVCALHERVDQTTGPLVDLHHERLRCGLGCADCCVDELTVFEGEAARIRQEYRAVLQEAPHPPGRCAMLDPSTMACRVYSARPYVCRTQGLPLRWIDVTEAGEAVELRDICVLNDTEPGVETLAPEACWTLGRFEGELMKLQRRLYPSVVRVALRGLFEMSRS